VSELSPDKDGAGVHSAFIPHKAEAIQRLRGDLQELVAPDEIKMDDIDVLCDMALASRNEPLPGCKHPSQFAFTEDGGKTIVCLLCERTRSHERRSGPVDRRANDPLAPNAPYRRMAAGRRAGDAERRTALLSPPSTTPRMTQSEIDEMQADVGETMQILGKALTGEDGVHIGNLPDMARELAPAASATPSIPEEVIEAALAHFYGSAWRKVYSLDTENAMRQDLRRDLEAALRRADGSTQP
jgi:hypothetical protein